MRKWQHRQRVALYLLVLFSACSSQAGELLNAFVDRREGHYLLHLDMRIQGKSDAVYRTLIDFNHLSLINDSIKSSQELEHKGRVHRVLTAVEGCVWIFCRRIKQVETVTELDGGYIMSVTDPSHSDLRYGRALWQVIDEGETTRIKYNADFVPAFWVPPLLGPMIFKRRLLEEGKKTINGIEHLIQQHQP